MAQVILTTSTDLAMIHNHYVGWFQRRADLYPRECDPLVKSRDVPIYQFESESVADSSI